MYEHKEPRLTKSGKIDKRFAANGMSKRWTPENTEKHGEKKRAEWGRKREETRKRHNEVAYQYEANPNMDLTKPVAEGEESNTKRLREARVAMSLPKIDTNDPAQVERRVNEYLDFCEINNKRPQMIGMANWLGLTRMQLYNYKTGRTLHEGAPVVQRALNMLEEVMVEQTMDVKGNPANLIFLLKNMFGYKDQTDVVINQGEDVPEMSKEDLEKWFLEDGKQVITTFADEQNGEEK